VLRRLSAVAPVLMCGKSPTLAPFLRQYVWGTVRACSRWHLTPPRPLTAPSPYSSGRGPQSPQAWRLPRATRPGASPSTSPSCRDCCGHTRAATSVLLERISRYDGKLVQAGGGVMRGFAILLTAAGFCFGTNNAVLAQATTPNVTPPFVGLSTPVTSTVTNCMMLCNSQAANCQTGCVIPAPPTTTPTGTTVTLNATSRTACTVGCTSSQLACQTNCSLASSQIGR
jgi:hypothetical protein